MKLAFLLICLFGDRFIAIKGDDEEKYPLAFSGIPPFSVVDCITRYFACSDDHTYGKWPMNFMPCLRDYLYCSSEQKWNRKVVKNGHIKTIVPVIPPKRFPLSEDGIKASEFIRDYLYTFFCSATICNEGSRKLTCGPYGKIKIFYLFFGRLEENVCRNYPLGYHPQLCISEGPHKKIYDNCNGENSCFVSPKKLDHEECYDDFPYLQIKYTCSFFGKPKVYASGYYDPSYILESVVDQNIKSYFSTSSQSYPWIQLSFNGKYSIREVLVYANKGQEYVDITSIEVKLTNGRVNTGYDFGLGIGSCKKRAPWDLRFVCKSLDTYDGLVVYSTAVGVLSVKEITIIVRKDGDGDGGGGGGGGKEIEIPYERSKTNIYTIIDKSCEKDTLEINCNRYMGNIEVIESILGRTVGACKADHPELECSKRIPGILPSCLSKPQCSPYEDELLRFYEDSFSQAQDCTGVNHYEIRYTCDGLPIPTVKTSSVDNGFTPDFLLFQETFASNYFSSKFEEGPWIDVFFDKTLAVCGIQFTIDYVQDTLANFENIEVRVGINSVIRKEDLTKNTLCGFYKGPSLPGQKYVVLSCGKDVILQGTHLSIQKQGRGVLQIRDIVVLLKPETKIKLELSLKGIFIEELFCNDQVYMTCENNGGGEILPARAYAGSTDDDNVCSAKSNVIRIKKNCEISLLPIVKNKCGTIPTCNLDFKGTEVCPEEIRFRRILYKCSNFKKPMARASSVESPDHEPYYALDGKIVTGNKFLFASKIEFGPWFEIDLKGTYIVKGLTIVFGDPDNLVTKLKINVLDVSYSKNLGSSRIGTFPQFRSTQLCAFIDRVPDPSHVYIKCNNNIYGRYIYIAIEEFAVMKLNEVVILLSST